MKSEEHEPAKMDLSGMQMLIPFVVILAVGGIIAAFSLQVEADTAEDMVTGEAGCNATARTACGLDYNATVKAQEGISNVTNKFPTIGLIGAIVVVIGLLIGGLYYLGTRM